MSQPIENTKARYTIFHGAYKSVFVYCFVFIAVSFHAVRADTEIGGTATSSTSFTLNGVVSISTLTISNLTMNGNIAFSPNTNGIIGTATNDNATSGNVGEYVSSTVGAVNALTSGQFGDNTSISLTAGDWDVSAMAICEANGATWTECDIGISTTSGNSQAGLTSGLNSAIGSWGSTINSPADQTITIQPYRLLLSATTTVYLKYRFVYSAGTPRTAGSAIRARRIR